AVPGDATGRDLKASADVGSLVVDVQCVSLSVPIAVDLYRPAQIIQPVEIIAHGDHVVAQTGVDGRRGIGPRAQHTDCVVAVPGREADPATVASAGRPVVHGKPNRVADIGNAYAA